MANKIETKLASGPLKKLTSNIGKLVSLQRLCQEDNVKISVKYDHTYNSTRKVLICLECTSGYYFIACLKSLETESIIIFDSTQVYHCLSSNLNIQYDQELQSIISSFAKKLEEQEKQNIPSGTKSSSIRF